MIEFREKPEYCFHVSLLKPTSNLLFLLPIVQIYHNLISYTRAGTILAPLGMCYRSILNMLSHKNIGDFSFKPQHFIKKPNVGIDL